MKVGGDHGGDSFKAWISLLNVATPNAPQSTSLFLMCHCRDSRENLERVLSPFKNQIEELSNTYWREKLIRVFVCGDYEFQTKLFGLSGPQGTHPCLWCCTKKTEMQQAPSDKSPQLRTIAGLKEDNERFRTEGQGDKSKAKMFNNVIERPIWDIVLNQVAPPYLHILLGVVKKHIVAMEKECHTLDMEIGKQLKKGVDLKEATELYRCYVRKCKNTAKAEQKLTKYMNKGDKRQQKLQKKIVDKLKTKMKLDHRKGPVCSHLAHLKFKHNIIEEGQHGGSYNGNHCNKFMQPDVFTDICNGIKEKTQELTECTELLNKADEIRNKFVTLNQRFHFVHTAISSAQPIKTNEIFGIQHAIKSYMNYLRLTFPTESITPKQHMLEHHCVSWIRDWGFGMGFHGEQGGERLHAVCNKLMRERFSGVKNKGKQLEYIMKTQHLKSCPDTIPSPPKKPRKQ